MRKPEIRNNKLKDVNGTFSNRVWVMHDGKAKIVLNKRYSKLLLSNGDAVNPEDVSVIEKIYEPATEDMRLTEWCYSILRMNYFLIVKRQAKNTGMFTDNNGIGHNIKDLIKVVNPYVIAKLREINNLKPDGSIVDKSSRPSISSIVNDGSSTNYYNVPTTTGSVDVDDIAEYLQLDGFLFNVLKSVFGCGIAAKSGSTRHAGTDSLRDANKMVHYATKYRDMLVRNEVKENTPSDWITNNGTCIYKDSVKVDVMFEGGSIHSEGTVGFWNFSLKEYVPIKKYRLHNEVSMDKDGWITHNDNFIYADNIDVEVVFKDGSTDSTYTVRHWKYLSDVESRDDISEYRRVLHD